MFDLNLQSKEPEYTKVRRKGKCLRDPHSESQGEFSIKMLFVRFYRQSDHSKQYENILVIIIIYRSKSLKFFSF